MFRLDPRSLLLSVLIALGGPALAQSGASEAPARTLEWPQLVPADWEPPIIADAHDETLTRDVDPAALVGDLEGQRVRLPGFMKPTVFDGRSVSEFLLVPYLPHHVTQHAHLEANQMVYVMLERPTFVENPLQPVWVSGVLDLRTVITDEGPAGYRITAATSSAYQY